MKALGARFPVGESLGRRYPEPPHPYRKTSSGTGIGSSHARAFRDWKTRTQVFTAGLSDHFRNRAGAHDRVAQIARTGCSAWG